MFVRVDVSVGVRVTETVELPLGLLLTDADELLVEVRVGVALVVGVFVPVSVLLNVLLRVWEAVPVFVVLVVEDRVGLLVLEFDQDRDREGVRELDAVDEAELEDDAVTEGLEVVLPDGLLLAVGAELDEPVPDSVCAGAADALGMTLPVAVGEVVVVAELEAEPVGEKDNDDDVEKLPVEDVVGLASGERDVVGLDVGERVALCVAVGGFVCVAERDALLGVTLCVGGVRVRVDERHLLGELEKDTMVPLAFLVDVGVRVGDFVAEAETVADSTQATRKRAAARARRAGRDIDIAK